MGSPLVAAGLASSREGAAPIESSRVSGVSGQWGRVGIMGEWAVGGGRWAVGWDGTGVVWAVGSGDWRQLCRLCG